MNREIKFKYIFKHEETGRIVTKVFDIGEIENAIFSDEFRDYAVVARCQDTGLHDKNGEGIYEGYVVKQWLSGTEDDKEFFTGVIEYLAPSFCIKVGEKSYIGLVNYGDNIEVIGNIYENPELLKETSQ